jgi:type I restriction-modification system DNA methylase subunit
MSVSDRIKKLVETFDNNLESYKKGIYNETQVRREFIDPFFEELGWDVTNKQGYAEAYKDVIHEDAIKVGGVTKAPDYCFRIGGVRKFFLEAKKPSINIHEDINPAYQLRRYGWSAKLPLSILTDFEEFAVYDCRAKPVKTDKVSHSRILCLRYTDYEARWEEITGIFSRDAILKGSFDKYIESNKGKKGTTEVDTAFLGEIENWRERLARNIALRNPSLSQRELNFAVQQTIDRIVFLRICEDRGMEYYGGLISLRNGSDVYKRLFHLFRKADEKYNSGLFHFKKEKGRENCDNLTPFLKIDDKPLKEIFRDLYYPESPYEFSVLSVDILGQVYERFLGKVIRLTAGHQAKIEEKPEVRKAGGVYYTPGYIVEYIVKNTVGKLVEGKKPGPRGGVSNLRILDPACGSGSFLIGAYQFLLDWHRDEYINDGTEKWSRGKTPRLYRSPKGEWRLTTEERKRILLNNIYGVDIDHQAVEVTKLSLLLKVLEGEDEQSIGKQMIMFQGRVLPDLSNNIKCGNSLIGPDFYEHQQMSLLDEEEIFRVNAFDWNTEFSDIMKDGGFDAVIGNPPYRQVTDREELSYFKNHYSICEGRVDLFELFIEKANALVQDGNAFSFIVPAPILTNQFSRKTRHLLAQQNALTLITTFSFPIFSDPTVHTCVFVSTKGASKHTRVYAGLESQNALNVEPNYTIEKDKLLFGENDVINVFITPKIRNLLDRLSEKSESLGNLCHMRQCIKTGDDSTYLKTSEANLKEPWKRALQGRGMNRYEICENRLWLNYGPWLARNWQNKEFYERPKIGIRETGSRLTATLDTENRYFLSSLYSVYYKDDNRRENLSYLLGVLNSEFASWLASIFALSATKGAFTKFRTNQLAPLPIRTINFDDPADVARHDQMVCLVNQMLELNKKLAESKMPQTTEMLRRQIESIDRRIDQLVYELYDLTEEEIKIVESES